MNTWNMWSDEVAKERQLLRDYKNPPRNKDTYKAQALRELSLRLNFEQEIFELKQRLGAAQDLLDGATAEELDRVNGMTVKYNQRLFDLFWGR